MNKKSSSKVCSLPSAIRSLRSCKLIVFDFDGVMTDNRVLVFEDGKEAVFCNRSDGIGADILRKKGFSLLILSTETNRVVKARADKLQMPVLFGIKNKKEALKKYCKDNGFDMKQACFVGNDLNDVEVMESVGLPVCSADAYPEVKKIAKLITDACGGEGVVRELAMHLCQDGKSA